jgi:hypothetical protein
MLQTVLLCVGGYLCVEFVLRLTVGRRVQQFAAREYLRVSRSPACVHLATRIRAGAGVEDFTRSEKRTFLWLYGWLSFLRAGSGQFLPPLREVPSADVPCQRPPARVLGAVRWFCGRETRDLIEIIRADLARDRREMKAEGRSDAFIWLQQTVVEWREILGIVFRFVVRLAVAANPLAKLIDRQ